MNDSERRELVNELISDTRSRPSSIDVEVYYNFAARKGEDITMDDVRYLKRRLPGVPSSFWAQVTHALKNN